jgi:hypothetical protein
MNGRYMRDRAGIIAAKSATLNAAISALDPATISATRALTFFANTAGHWIGHVSMNYGQRRQPLDGNGFTLYFNSEHHFRATPEGARIERFYAALKRARIKYDLIVSGTKTGPDVLLRLADGSAAVVEIRGRCVPVGHHAFLAKRYGHLAGIFRIYLAVEQREGRWTLERFTPTGMRSERLEVLSA